MNFLSRLFIFYPIKENKKFTKVFTRNISDLAALKLVMSGLEIAPDTGAFAT